VNTDNVLPAARTISLLNVFREDEVTPSYPQADVLANAPRKQENCFKVKAILD